MEGGRLSSKGFLKTLSPHSILNLCKRIIGHDGLYFETCTRTNALFYVRVRMSEFVACSYRLLRSLILERDKEPSVPCTVPSLPPHNQPWSRETKPFDWDGQGAVQGRLIGRVKTEIGIEIFWQRGPNSLLASHNRLLAQLQGNPEESSFTGQNRRKRRKSDSLVGAESLISDGLEYMLMCLTQMVAINGYFI